LTAPEEEELSSQPEFWFEFPVLSRLLGLEIGQYTPKSMGSSSLLLSKKDKKQLGGYSMDSIFRHAFGRVTRCRLKKTRVMILLWKNQGRRAGKG
jgi:hypothetical protein